MSKAEQDLRDVGHDPVAASAAAEIVIRAPLEAVWRLHTDIDHWRDWNTKIERSALDGPLMIGAVFKWKSGGASIVSTIQELEPLRRIAWTGEAMGARAHHDWSFEQRADGVLIRTQESFDGWWPRLFPGLTRRMLEGILLSWLQDLKRCAEAEGP